MVWWMQLPISHMVLKSDIILGIKWFSFHKELNFYCLGRAQCRKHENKGGFLWRWQLQIPFILHSLQIQLMSPGPQSLSSKATNLSSLHLSNFTFITLCCSATASQAPPDKPFDSSFHRGLNEFFSKQPMVWKQVLTCASTSGLS